MLMGLLRGASPPCRLLDRCRTRAGSRLLKANLLQPPAHLPTIQLRQAAVAELLASGQGKLAAVQSALGAMPPALDK